MFPGGPVSVYNPPGMEEAVALVDTCTRESLGGGADWPSNLALVDLLSARPQVAQYAIVALNGRLTHKSNAVGLSAVLLVEALVKNCPCVHPLIATREWLKMLLHVIPKAVRNPSAKMLVFRKDIPREPLGPERWDRILQALQSWARAFKLDSTFPIFLEMYRSCQRKGVRFPESEKTEEAPVFTPPRNPHTQTQFSKISKTSSASEGPARFTDPECSHAFSTAQVLLDILHASSSAAELKSNDLVHELVTSLQTAQMSIGSRLQTAPAGPQGEIALTELLQLNDIIVDVFKVYDGILKGDVPAKRRPQAEPQKTHASAPPEESDSESEDEEEEEEDPNPVPAKTTSVAVPSVKLPPPSSMSTRKSSRGQRGSHQGSSGSPAVGPTAAPKPSTTSPPKASAPVPDLLDLFGAAPASSALSSSAPFATKGVATFQASNSGSGASSGKPKAPSADPFGDDDDDPFMQLANRDADKSSACSDPFAAFDAAPVTTTSHITSSSLAAAPAKASLPTLDDFDRLALGM